MAFRLTYPLGQHTHKVALAAGESSIGSDPSSQIRLTHPTVSRQHAVLSVEHDTVYVEDLGSSNGTRIGNRKVVERTQVMPGNSLSFGSVITTLEEVRDGDLRPAISLDPLPTASPRLAPESERIATAPTTLSASALEEFTLVRLPRLLGRLAEGADGMAMAQEVGAAIFRSFPCLKVEILRRDTAQPAMLFNAEVPDYEPDRGAGVESRGSTLVLRAYFFPPSLAQTYASVVETGKQLIELGLRRRPLDSQGTTRETLSPPPLPAPPTVDSAVQEIYRQAVRVARSDVSVLVQGESGTGKEVLARYLHAASGRPDDKFVALNCAALPRDLLELELFGIEQAVATGVDARPGKFELASDGTLFLDEIGDMAVETQAKILRVLQEKEVYRLGGKQPREAKVRVLAATNRNIESMVREGGFRSDLYHRIAGWVVHLPALRQRRGDIPNLAAHFLRQEAEKHGLRLSGISQSAMEAMLAHEWTGNIRELQREIARAALFLSDGELLESTHLQTSTFRPPPEREETLKDVLERVERETLENALRSTGGDTQAAAQRLGIGRSTLYRRMKALDVQEVE